MAKTDPAIKNGCKMGSLIGLSDDCETPRYASIISLYELPVCAIEMS